MNTDSPRVAWLFPSLQKGNYWHPIFSEYKKLFDNIIIYTGLWPGFSPGFEDAFTVDVVGTTKCFYPSASITEQGSSFIYSSLFIYASPSIIGRLFRFKPNVIFSSGFSIWTVLALMLKPLGHWKVVILYDGSSPSIDSRNSHLRLFARRLMTQFVDGFVANSRAAKNYLLEWLEITPNFLFEGPYLVPDTKALLQQSKKVELKNLELQHPVFLYVGEIVSRKGVEVLLEACSILHEKGYRDYTILVVGDGEQRNHLQNFVRIYDLEQQIVWTGWVAYEQLGTYFQLADIFVFPTFEDIWGMVVPEAMAFGKTILCSKQAGAVEMVIDGENGYTFDPYQPRELARLMQQLIENPNDITSMGQKSLELISCHTPRSAAELFHKVTSFVLKK